MKIDKNMVALGVFVAVGLSLLVYEPSKKKQASTANTPVVQEQRPPRPKDKGYDKSIKIHLDTHINENLKKSWWDCLTYQDMVIFASKEMTGDFDVLETDRYLDECYRYLTGGAWEGQHFYECNMEKKLSIIATYLTKLKGIAYDHSSSNPDSFLMHHLIRNKKGNCTTMPILFALVCERMGIPVSLVTVKDHVFCRYDDGTTRINVECTSDKSTGVGISDRDYIEDLKVSTKAVRNGIYMRSMTLQETLGLLYSNQLAYYLKKNETEHIPRLFAYIFYLYDKDTFSTMNFMNYIYDSEFVSRHNQALCFALADHLKGFGMNVNYPGKKAHNEWEQKQQEIDNDPEYYSRKMQKQQNDFLKKHQDDLRRKRQEEQRRMFPDSGGF